MAAAGWLCVSAAGCCAAVCGCVRVAVAVWRCVLLAAVAGTVWPMRQRVRVFFDSMY